MIDFYERLPEAYVKITEKFNQFREEFDDFFWLKEFDKISATPIKVPRDQSLNSRVTISLGNGYAIKVMAYREKTLGNYILLNPIKNINQKFVEENNVRVLKKYGFTLENGFIVPEHKVVGIVLSNVGMIIRPNGYGITITEDLSDNGNAQVVEFDQKLFSTLDNGDMLRTEYEKHFEALLGLYRHPNINGTINRYETWVNPDKSLERMLLVVIKKNCGKIAIADLDNLVFDEVEQSNWSVS